MNKRQFRIALTLVFLAYAILTAYWWITIHRPYEKYPDWTNEERIKIKKIIDRKTTVHRIGLKEAYYFRAGKQWRIGL